FRDSFSAGVQTGDPSAEWRRTGSPARSAADTVVQRRLRSDLSTLDCSETDERPSSTRYPQWTIDLSVWLFNDHRARGESATAKSVRSLASSNSTGCGDPDRYARAAVVHSRLKARRAGRSAAAA